MKNCAVLICMIVLSLFSVSIKAQETGKKESKVVESERIISVEQKVGKLKEAVNDPKSKQANPTDLKKTGPVYGPDYCDVVIDNYTNLYIKVWVDDNYQGVVGPYGKITVAAIKGKTTLYARADFTDGSYAYWNPSAFDCSYEYTWRLR